MGIPIGGKHRRRRRSYADYKPSGRPKRTGNDPFRILGYILLISALIWGYNNQELVLDRLDEVSGQLAEENDVIPVLGPTNTPTPDLAEIENQAIEAYQNGDLDTAIELYREANTLAPNEVRYPFETARLLLYTAAVEIGTQRELLLDEALTAAELAILANPEDPAGYAIAGKIMDWQGRPEEAINQIQLAIEINDQYALAYSYMAEAYVDLDRWDQAVETVQIALSLDSNHVDIRRDYGYILESLGDYGSATIQYEAAQTLHPKLPYVQMALGRNYRQLGRYADAVDAFFRAEALLPENALIPFEVGFTYEAYVGDPNTAIGFYEQAVELNPNFASAWARIGSIHYFQESYAQAIPSLERAIALGNDTAELNIRLGIAYASQGQCGEALQYLNQGQALSEGDERLLDAVLIGFDLCSLPTPEPFASGDDNS